MSEDIKGQIRQFVIANFLFDDGEAILPDDASLLRQNIIDSTGVLALVMFMEETFGIPVADKDIIPQNFDSINGLVGYAQSKMALVAA